MTFDVQAYLRKERREGILLALTGALFVALGIVVFMIGNTWLALIGVLFFGTCIPLGIFQALRPGRHLRPALGIIGALGFAAAGVIMIVGAVSGVEFLGTRQGVALPLGILLVAFFGVGAVLLIVREVRGRT